MRKKVNGTSFESVRLPVIEKGERSGARRYLYRLKRPMKNLDV